MDRSQKADAVAQLSDVFNQAGVVVVTRNLVPFAVAMTLLLGAAMQLSVSTHSPFIYFRF